MYLGTWVSPRVTARKRRLTRRTSDDSSGTGAGEGFLAGGGGGEGFLGGGEGEDERPPLAPSHGGGERPLRAADELRGNRGSNERGGAGG